MQPDLDDSHGEVAFGAARDTYPASLSRQGKKNDPSGLGGGAGREGPDTEEESGLGCVSCGLERDHASDSDVPVIEGQEGARERMLELPDSGLPMPRIP